MYYELHDCESEEIMGTVRVTNPEECTEQQVAWCEEVSESWDEFNRCEEHDYADSTDVDSFVEWNNQNRVTQLERITIEFCQPSDD